METCSFRMIFQADNIQICKWPIVTDCFKNYFVSYLVVISNSTSNAPFVYEALRFPLPLLHFIRFDIHLFVSSYTWFFIFYFVLLSFNTFSRCPSHTVGTFCLSSCIWNLVQNAVNHAHRASCTENGQNRTCSHPIKQMPFGVKRLNIIFGAR